MSSMMLATMASSSPSLLFPCKFSAHRMKSSSPLPRSHREQPATFSSVAATGAAVSTFSRSSAFSSSFELPVRVCCGTSLSLLPGRGLGVICYSKPTDEDTTPGWPILKRWDVPWPWQTVLLTSFACGLSFILAGLVETAAVPYLGLQISELSLDEKAELLFVDQGYELFTSHCITTVAVLGALFTITKSFQPLPDEVFRYDLREPFNLQKGWLLWAVIGLAGALGSIALLGLAMSYFSDENHPQRETDALVLLLPLIGSSSVSTLCLVGITGVLAPVLEETLFRGFLMASLTKWVPTPLSIVISATAFSLAHLTPGEFPQLFFLEPKSPFIIDAGTVLGLSYAQTRNLLTPIIVHSLWNSGVILLLTFLQLQGYDIKELLQASQ
ncbi:hypothetical protein AKJ16_DCAP00162 [Drosera capensis]